jgi:hypothetical protein
MAAQKLQTAVRLAKESQAEVRVALKQIVQWKALEKVEKA